MIKTRLVASHQPSRKNMSNSELKTINNDLSEYLTKAHIDSFLSGIFTEATPLTNNIISKYNSPPLGAHLVSSRLIYTHHGIYIGNNQVIHYSGLADGLSSGPVEKTSLESFCAGKNFEIKPHPNATFSPEEIVNRAHSRLSESKYNLVINNCEHFVHWCIYNMDTSKQVQSVKKVAITTTAKEIAKKTPYGALAIAASEMKDTTMAYINGNITKEKFFEDISHNAITTTSSAFYTALGQAAIPIPVVGALVGAGVGYYIGNMLHCSGHIAIGETQAVKAAKQRRAEIEALCKVLIPSIQKSRQELEEYINTYFSERKVIFESAFQNIDKALQNWEPDELTRALNEINSQFGKTLQFASFSEFDDFMQSNEALEF